MKGEIGHRRGAGGGPGPRGEPAPAAPLRVLLADDDPRVLAALTEAFQRTPGVQVVARAGDGPTAVALAVRYRPDVAVLDVKMPGGGIEACRAIVGRLPGTRVLALSAYADRAVVSGMLRAGAVGYVVKGTPVAEIVEAVLRTARAQGSLSPEAVGSLHDHLEEVVASSERSEEARQARRLQVEAALEPGAIRPLYQPIVELESRRVVGYEALARFPLAPDRPPAQWFADAASVGLTAELELAALRSALLLFDAIPRASYLSVNLSPSTVLLAEAADILAGLPGERLVLEVTEHAPVPDYGALRSALAPLLHRGCRLAVDDVGAGFASLRHIVQLAPHVIKLDVTLTRGIEADRTQRALAAALVSFAGEMGIQLVAEGVETATELATLRALGVRLGQGFLLGRPGPLPEG
jgi:EAL domain-containing protein (putative c-di-GMP-specific phosphodiesterase class I)/response regulator of citrate/malate metabolism